MEKNILIDGSNPKSPRCAIVENSILQDFTFDIKSKDSLRGNIYIGVVTRVEDSLQSAFIEYGGSKAGFLPLAEIHHSYFQGASSSQKAEISKSMKYSLVKNKPFVFENEDVESANDSSAEEAPKPPKKVMVKLTDIIKKGQLILVQVIKEERGNKGVMLTTYISISGRYFVYMPNTDKGNGISKRIDNQFEKKRIKSVINRLPLNSSSVVARTSSNNVPEEQLVGDFKYLNELWKEVAQKAAKTKEPGMLHEDSNSLQKCVTDYFTDEISSVIVQGEESYKILHDFTQKSAFKDIKLVKHDSITPIFNKYNVHEQINQLFSKNVALRSGGSIVIEHTEALTSIDVNSGRGTSESNIEKTAFKTNIEAAHEIARQLYLRSVSGLIVVDFIDMTIGANRKKLEDVLWKCFVKDKARVKISKISPFGLVEISRQRTRPNLYELISVECKVCNGSGFGKSLEYQALSLIQNIDTTAYNKVKIAYFNAIDVYVDSELASYLLNHKKYSLLAIEEKYQCMIFVNIANNGESGIFCYTKVPEGITETGHSEAFSVSAKSIDNIAELQKKNLSLMGKLKLVLRGKQD